MQDNYYTISDEKGSINISEDVIAVIASNAVSEVDGIAAFSNAAGTERIGKKTASKGIRVSFEEDRVNIDITVMVRCGTNITGIGEKIQKSVSAAVESMTGLRSAVNVHISGVSFDK